MSALKGEVTVFEPTRAQQAIARRVAEARATIPHLAVDVELDLDQVIERDASPFDWAIGACARALREFPTLNGSYRDGHFELYSRVNIGVAVTTEASQAMPTILDADLKSVREIADERRALTARVRDGTISSAELAGATFTISASEDATRLQALILAPHAAALALGAARSIVTLEQGRPAQRRVMTASLSCDHRIVYGATAGAFVARVRELLAALGSWA